MNAGTAGEYVYYRCKSQHHLNALVPCGNAYHPVSDVDAAVWGQLSSVVLDEKIRRRAAKLSEEQDPAAGESEAVRLEAALKKVDQFQIHLLRQKAAGLIVDSVYDQMMEEQASKRRSLMPELEAIRSRSRGAAAVREALTTINQRMTAIAGEISRADFAVRRAILEKLVPDEKPYGVYVSAGQIEIKGLLLGDTTSSPATGADRSLAMTARSSE